MKRSRTFVNAIVIAVFTVVCLLGIEYLAVNIGQGVPFSSNYNVHAVFSDADGVPTAADVRVSGVNVGKVVDVSHSSSYPGETVVTLPPKRRASVSCRRRRKGQPRFPQ